MNILIMDDGARAHALAWKLAESRRAGDIYATGDSAGVQTLCIPIKAPEDMGAWCAENNALDLESGPPERIGEPHYELPCFVSGARLYPARPVFVDGQRAHTEDIDLSGFIERVDMGLFRGFFGTINLNIGANKRDILSYNRGFGFFGAQTVLPVLRGDLCELFHNCALGLEPVFDIVRSCAVLELPVGEGKIIEGLDELPGNVGVFISGCRWDGAMRAAENASIYLACRADSAEKAAGALDPAAALLSFV